MNDNIDERIQKLLHRIRDDSTEIGSLRFETQILPMLYRLREAMKKVELICHRSEDMVATFQSAYNELCREIRKIERRNEET
jgi:ribosome-associated translation inhibitor RaiA